MSMPALLGAGSPLPQKGRPAARLSVSLQTTWPPSLVTQVTKTQQRTAWVQILGTSFLSGSSPHSRCLREDFPNNGDQL